MTTRRQFLARAAGACSTLVFGAGALSAQGVQDPQDPRGEQAPAAGTDSMPGMNGQIRPVRLPPKADAKPVLTQDERDALEHHLHCQCGTCTLDVYTCRTTDFTCQVSPAMHRDVMALVEGGYGAQEIIDAFVGTYGERVLMAPKRSGFNLLAWFTPGVAVVVAGGAIAMLLHRWNSENPAPVASPLRGVDATSDELARLEAAVRGDDRA
jgi:cytochrome c-type biogenesis protein CcmH